MDFATLALLVAAAFVHATWNYLAKSISGGLTLVWSYSAASALLYLPLAAWFALRDPGQWTQAGCVAIVVSGLIHLAYAASLQTAYRKADLSVVYPVARGTGPTLAVAGAILVLGEPFTASSLAGAALIVSGVLVIGLAGRQRGDVWTGVRWGALTGSVIACYTLVDGYSVRFLALSPVVLDYFGNLVRLAAVTPHAVRDRVELRRCWSHGVRLWALGALMPLSYILVLFAMTRAPVSVIAPARELSMMVGVLLGWWLLKERDVARRLAGAGLICAGVVLLSN